MRFEDTTFVALVQRYGLRRLLGSPDLAAATVVTAALMWWANAVPGVFERASDVGAVLAGVAGGLFGIVLAALAIVTALSESPLVVELQRKDMWQNVLFLFFWDSAAAICSIVSGVVLELTPKADVSETSLRLLSCVSIFIFLYAIFAALQLVGVVLRLALYHAEHHANDSDGELKKDTQK